MKSRKKNKKKRKRSQFESDEEEDSDSGFEKDKKKNPPKKKFKISFPRILKKDVCDFAFVSGNPRWNKNHNIKTNKLLMFKIFKNRIKLNNDLYAFYTLSEIDMAIPNPEKSLIFGYETDQGKRVFLVGKLEAIKEIIKKKENHLHEVIQDIPIRLFLDIERPIENPKKYKIARKKTEAFMKEFGKQYKNYLDEELGLEIMDKDWLVLDACKKTKISFHVIGHHIDQYKRPIYYKDVDHVKLIIQKILEIMDKKFYDDLNVDLAFFLRKSLRMYYCSYKKERDRIFVNVKNKDLFCDKDFENSILHIHPKLIVGCTEYTLVEMVEDCGNKEQVIKTLKFKKSTRLVGLGKSSSGKHETLPKSLNPIAKKMVDCLIKLLIAMKKCKHPRLGKFEFEYLEKYKDDFEIYRVTKEVNKEKPLSMAIDLKSKEMYCLLQNYQHTHSNGRRIFLNPHKGELVIYCCTGKMFMHDKCRLPLFVYESAAMKRLGVKKYYKLLVKKVKDL